MMKKNNLLKLILLFLIVFSLCVNVFAAVVSDNDGAAFITKAEFDSLKNTFQSTLNEYNSNIDNKIDKAISDYLAGVKNSKVGTVNTKDTSIYWSIGPFDRPRFKKGYALYDLMTMRVFFYNGETYTNKNTTTYFVLKASWGSDFTNKTEIVDSRWAYTDLICTDCSEYATDAKFLGVYTNSAHFVQHWNLWNPNTSWSDGLSPSYYGQTIYPGLSGQHASTPNYSINFRPTGPNGTMTWFGNPTFAAYSGAGHTNMATINKGSKISWDNHISAFGPISYNCFNKEVKNFDYGAPVYNNGIYDEILYEPVDLTQANGSTINVPGQKNLLYMHCPDIAHAANAAYNPWSKTISPVSKYHSAIALYDADPANYVYGLGENTLQIDEGWVGTGAGSTYTWPFDRYYMQDIKFLGINNWNKLGIATDTSVKNYVNSLTSQNALFKNTETKEELLSLAAGLPVCDIEKKTKVTVTGEFRKNCAYSYNTTTRTNVLNEGTIDNTEPYVVYAKLTPFDITKLPENETDLIDISKLSSETTKDSDSKGKLAKCRIVRDGKLKFEIPNNDAKDKVVFIKWEKLSNWNSTRTTRNTAGATNVNNRTDGSNTATRTNPTWTYFGGGYLKLDSKLSWESLN